MLEAAGVASAGTAASFITAGHIMRTRRAHQVTICALNALQENALKNSTKDCENQPTFTKWCEERKKESPLFQFWHLTLSMELLLNMFVQLLRTENFHLYIDCLTKMIPWFFALDRIHYARWLPVHLRDMSTLKHTHPSVAAEFLKGNFVLK